MWFIRFIGLLGWCGIVGGFFVKFIFDNHDNDIFCGVWGIMMLSYYLAVNVLAVINLKYLYSTDNKSFEQAALNEPEANKHKVIFRLIYIALIVLAIFYFWYMFIKHHHTN